MNDDVHILSIHSRYDDVMDEDVEAGAGNPEHWTIEFARHVVDIVARAVDKWSDDSAAAVSLGPLAPIMNDHNMRV